MTTSFERVEDPDVKSLEITLISGCDN